LSNQLKFLFNLFPGKDSHNSLMCFIRRSRSSDNHVQDADIQGQQKIIFNSEEMSDKQNFRNSQLSYYEWIAEYLVSKES